MSMRKIILFIVLFKTCYLPAQQLAVEANGLYIYSGQWDRAIQTLNFSTPQFGIQPLLQFGAGIGASYYFKNLQQGLQLNYGLVQSVNEVPGRKTAFELHQLNLHYLYAPKLFKKETLHFVISGGFVSTMLLKRINSAYYTYDDQLAKAVGIGPDFAVQFKYTLGVGDAFKWQPFIRAGYSPFLWSPKSEAIINHTNGMSSNDYTMLLRAQVGIEIHLIK